MTNQPAEQPETVTLEGVPRDVVRKLQRIEELTRNVNTRRSQRSREVHQLVTDVLSTLSQPAGTLDAVVRELIEAVYDYPLPDVYGTNPLSIKAERIYAACTDLEEALAAARIRAVVKGEA